MAYGLKFELLCTPRKGNLYTVKVLFDEYVENQIDRNIPQLPGSIVLARSLVVPMSISDN